MVVYIDIFILENFIVNLFLLLFTFKVLRVEYKKYVIYLSAIIGSLYSVVLFFDKLTIMTSLPFKIFVALIMVAITMKKLNFKLMIKLTSCFFVGTFTLAGICFGTSLITNSYSIYENFTISNGSIKTIILTVLVLYIVLTRIAEYVRERNTVSNFLYDIEIPLDASKLTVKAFLDTGNCLREPVTNLPCIILENSIFELLKKKDEECFSISYNTISENGKMFGIKGKQIKIISNGGEWRTVDVILCGCPNKLSEENEFNALLSRGII